MSTQVRILNVTYVSLPESPAPTNDRIALSSFDDVWIPFPPVQRLIFYDDTALLPPFPSLLKSLKSSLSSALLCYTPLAGKLTYLPISSDVIIDCSAAAVGDGVAFVEAEADGDGDIRRLAGDEVHDVEAFLKLVPGLDVRELPAPVFSVQVTRFVSGGVAVGFSAHHAVADGKALWKFFEAWVGCCRGDTPANATFDRAVITHPSWGEEITRRFLKMVPSLPVISVQKEIANEGRFQLSRRTFVLSSETIRSLKQRILLHSNPALPPPSTFVSITSKIWVAFVQSKSFNPADDVHFAFLADCRTRLDPPIDEWYFGNCVTGCFARAIAADLLGEDGLFIASLAIQKAIRESLEDSCALDDWMDTYIGLPKARSMNVAASPRFKVYELADFGWGKPSRVELVSMNQDGEVVLVSAREEGGVQVSVSLNPLHMEAFKNHCLSL